MYKTHIKDIKIKKDFSQNFVRSKEVISKEAYYLNINPQEIVLEVGPGLGDLTEELVKYTKKFVCIEKDKQFKKILLNNSKLSKLKFVWGDASEKECVEKLKFDKVISNLPYKFSLPIIFNLLENTCFKEGVFILQNELAQKICAKPSKPSYGRVSVYAQTFGKFQYLQKVNKGAFYPEPNVESAMIRVIYDVSEDSKFIRKYHKQYKEFLEVVFNKRDCRIIDILKDRSLKQIDQITMHKYPAQLFYKEYVKLFLEYSGYKR